MICVEEITGLVLAGGRSSRMQYDGSDTVDKGLLSFKGRPLVNHALACFSGQVGQVLISANRHVDNYAAYGEVITDTGQFGSYAGPLAGIYTALEHISTPWLAVMPVDVVGLPSDLFQRLCCEAIGAQADLVYAQSGDRAHPLCAVMRTDLKNSLRTYLQQGGRRVHEWMSRQGARPVLFKADQASFININTPPDLCHALANSP